MGEEQMGGFAPAVAPSEPVLVSQRRGIHLALVVLLGATAAFGLFAMVASVIFLGDLGRARVLGPADEPGRTRVAVLDGPDPKGWIIPSDEVGDAQPGDVIDVRLGGSCQCEPYGADGDPVAVFVLGASLMVLFAVCLVNYVRNRRSQVSQSRAARVLAADAPVTPVLLVPSIRWIRKKPTVRARVVTAAGVEIGELDIGRVRPAFDPTLRWWLVGQPQVGSAVALVSEHRRQVLLPSSPLGVPTDAPAWSATAVSRLGWDAAPAGPDAVLVLPSQGRVAVPSVAIDPSGPSPEQRQQTAEVQQQARKLLLIGLATVVAVILAVNILQVPTPIAFLLIVATMFLVGKVANRSVRRSAQGTLDLEPGDRPHAMEIATSLAAWQNKAVRAPAFRRTLPVAAV